MDRRKINRLRCVSISEGFRSQSTKVNETKKPYISISHQEAIAIQLNEKWDKWKKIEYICRISGHDPEDHFGKWIDRVGLDEVFIKTYKYFGQKVD